MAWGKDVAIHSTVRLAVALGLLGAACGDGAPEAVTTARASLIVSSVTVRFTHLYIGRSGVDGLYEAGVNFAGGTVPTVPVWDCPHSASSGFGTIAPDSRTHDNVCDPPTSSGQDIFELRPELGQTIRTLITPDNIGAQIPVKIGFHEPQSLMDFDWLFNVRAADGVITFEPVQGGVRAEMRGSAFCARSPQDWVLCWEVELGPLGSGQLSFPWNVVDPDPAASANHDPNNLRLNPRWKWQTIPQSPLVYGNCPITGCTSQHTTENKPSQSIGGTVPFTCSSTAVGSEGLGHLNWEVVTYPGILNWEGHSVISLCTIPQAVADLDIPSPDDDYNIHLDTLVTNDHRSGSTGSNSQIKMEFKASETVDNFGGYWSRFRSDVDDCSSNPVGVNGKDGIAIGLLGLDMEHDRASELHPTFGLAIHANSDPVNDVWEIFARNFGNEGFCSSKMLYLVSSAGRNSPFDLTFQLPRPASVPATTVPTVAPNFQATASLTVRLTRLYIGRSGSTGLYSAGANLAGGSVHTAPVWDCPHTASAFGMFAPEGQTRDATCDPPNAFGTNLQDIALLEPVLNQTVFTAPAVQGTGLHPVTIGFTDPQSLFKFEWLFQVDLPSGAVTFEAQQGAVRSERQGSAFCARNGQDWMLCWEVEVGPPSPPVEVNVGPNQDAFVTFHLPAPPHSGEGQARAGEVRLNWTGGPAPPPFQVRSVSTSALPTIESGEAEEQLLERARGLTPEQLATLAVLSPQRTASPNAMVDVATAVHVGPPPPAASLAVDSADDAAADQHRLDVLRAFCGALGGQSPTGAGSCTAFPPATLIAYTGAPGPNGWFTSPVTVTLTPVDAGGNGIDHTEYSFDDVLWTPYVGPFVLPEGNVVLRFRTVDGAGNVEPTQQRSFAIDTRPPSSTASASVGAAGVALAFAVSDPAPGSGPAGLHTVSKVGNTATLDTRFTPGASGTVSLATSCTDIEYWGEDVAGNAEAPHHRLADSRAPVLVVPPDVTTSTCTASAAVDVGQAMVTDECVVPAQPTGRVIATNGVPLAPPLPVVNGRVTLGIGTHIVEWTASDGTNGVSRIQTVAVRPRIQAGESFLVDDRASVRIGGGAPAAVVNSGTSLTQIGNDARSGDVLSVGPIRILHRAVVTGNATSAGTVFKEVDGTVTGTISQGRSVVLPALPALPTFPAATAGSFTVSSGTQTRQPGSYQSGTVNGGTLVLLGGDYFFRSLAVNANVTVRIAPTTRIFVRDSLVVRSPFLASTGTAIQSTFLGFAGTSLLLEAPVDGTLVAPNAAVSFGIGSGLTFRGSFFARILEVRPASALECR